MSLPTPITAGGVLTGVQNYLNVKGASYVVQDIEQAVHAERELQRKACRGDTEWPTEVALFEALCRRVHRNLAMRGLPLGVQATEVGGIRPALEDAEVRRLERPFRKVVVG